MSLLAKFQVFTCMFAVREASSKLRFFAFSSKITTLQSVWLEQNGVYGDRIYMITEYHKRSTKARKNQSGRSWNGAKGLIGKSAKSKSTKHLPRANNHETRSYKIICKIIQVLTQWSCMIISDQTKNRTENRSLGSSYQKHTARFWYDLHFWSDKIVLYDLFWFTLI
jgi:hypothetical protein